MQKPMNELPEDDDKWVNLVLSGKKIGELENKAPTFSDIKLFGKRM
ncbi:MAG TPA: hypothetical protein VJY36_02170 [Candidatus Bathyarchaeia archaeon]|jgi:hypothetical protein|nr:hypothetical protein [Candidatus Bathyarchaeia archaeon]